jgi:integrase
VREALASGDYAAVVLTEMVELKDAIRYHDSAARLADWAALARKARPDVRLYLYETWHRLGDPAGWLERIDADLPALWEGQVLRAAMARAGLEAGVIHVIPGGQVMAAAVRAVEAGQVPGLTRREEFFTDDIHLNDIGAWLIAMTGMRGSEAAGLTVDRVNFLHKTITIDRQLARDIHGPDLFGPVKTPSSNRVIPMADDLAVILLEHIESRPPGPDGLLFRGRQGNPFTSTRRSEAFRAAAAGLGLPEAARGWHALRHTFGSQLLASGVDVVTVSGWLGHNGPAETLATYAHVNQATLDASRNVIGTVYSRKQA